MNWRDHKNQFTTDAVVSAQKALDYLDGDQKTHIEEILDDNLRGITKWRERGVVPVCANITNKIISRSALTYQTAPTRDLKIGETINEAASVKYAELLGADGGVAINASDIVSRLLKTCLILVQYIAETGKLSFSILHRGNCDVDYDLVTKEIKSIFYTAGGVGPSGGKMFHYWDKTQIVDIEENNKNLKVVASESNPYGIIPVMIRYDLSPPRTGFWIKAGWEELIQLNETVNMFNTEVRFASKLQNFPPLFANVNIPAGAVIGPDAVVEFENLNDEIYLEYKKPETNLAEFKSWLNDLQNVIAENWGVNLKTAGEGAADSGFKLVVEEIWNLETRLQRQKAAKVAEGQLHSVIQTVSDVHSLGLPAGDLITNFAEPSLPVDTAATRQENRADIASGIMSREQAWRNDDPEITPEDIEKRKMEIDGAAIPDFNDVV